MSHPASAVYLPSRSPSRQPAVPAGLPKKMEMRVVVVEKAADLEPYLKSWDALAEAALEPNVFYESWMLRPAIEHLGRDEDLLFVLVVGQLPEGSPHAPLLCGLFPLQRHKRYKGLPVSALSLWRYMHCYLCTPLLRAAYAQPALEAFFDWLKTDPRAAPVMEWTWIGGEGPFHRLLSEHLTESQTPVFHDESYLRALMCAQDSAQEYLDQALSGDRRRKLRRNEKGLAEQGAVEYARLESEDEVESWLEDFLRLEASGWKGQEGTALGCNDGDRQFFLAVMKEAFRRNRLFLMALRVGGKPVAFSGDLLAGEWSCIFKVAFDEAFTSFAPGILLEIEKVRRIHEQPPIRWVDSCNKPGPSVLKELLIERRLIETLAVAPGKAPGPLVISLLPLLRWLRRKASAIKGRLRGRPKDAHGAAS